MPDANSRITRLKRAITRGEEALLSFSRIRDELTRLRRAADRDHAQRIDEMLALNAAALSNTDRALITARQDLRLEQAKKRTREV
jgi:hypothetical protein